MGILTYLGQTFSEANYTNTSNGTLDDAVVIAIISYIVLGLIIFGIILYILIAIGLMKIFKKAGVKPWAAWVPFYNIWKTLELGGQAGFWAVFLLVPIVSLVSAVYVYIALYHIGKKLGESGWYVLMGIFYPYVWALWLGFNKSKWNDKASNAPSLVKTKHSKV